MPYPSTPPRLSMVWLLQVRVYVLRAYNLQPTDSNGLSDPYLKLRLGKRKANNKSRFKPKTLNPQFFEVFEFNTVLPGESQLSIEVWDHDMISSDDHIGTTVIDLEDRWFDKRWKAMGSEALEQDKRLLAMQANSAQPDLEANAKKTAIDKKVCVPQPFASALHPHHTTPQQQAASATSARLCVCCMPDLFHDVGSGCSFLFCSSTLVQEWHRSRWSAASCGLPRLQTHRVCWSAGSMFLLAMSATSSLSWTSSHLRQRCALGPRSPCLLLMCMWECGTELTDGLSSHRFEMRLVIWKTRDVVAMDTVTNQNDLFVRCWMEGDDKAKQQTDCHYRCKHGKGSFNWRMKFKLELPQKFPYLHVQIWDRDIFSYNDCIAEAVLDMSAAFKRAFKLKKGFVMFQEEKDGHDDDGHAALGGFDSGDEETKVRWECGGRMPCPPWCPRR